MVLSETSANLGCRSTSSGTEFREAAYDVMVVSPLRPTMADTEILVPTTYEEQFVKP